LEEQAGAPAPVVDGSPEGDEARQCKPIIDGEQGIVTGMLDQSKNTAEPSPKSTSGLMPCPSSEDDVDEIKLRADGVDVVMRVKRVDRVASHVEFDLHLEFASHVAASVPPRLGCRLSHDDLGRLIDFMTRHVGPDERHVIEASPTYVTYDRDFLIQALSGEADDHSNGDFTLLWLITCLPRPGSGGTGVDVGFKSVVESREVLRWCDELRTLQQSLMRAPP
jgi:hypothetical protein